jgi:hypothetical protein
VSELEERFHQQKRYGMSIRRIVKKRMTAPRQLPPLEADARQVISKSVIVPEKGGIAQAVMQIEDQREKHPSVTS